MKRTNVGANPLFVTTLRPLHRIGVLPGFPAAHVPLWAVGLSFGFCAAVGIIFGIVPAAKAAQLNPIDALRYE